MTWYGLSVFLAGRLLTIEAQIELVLHENRDYRAEPTHNFTKKF